MHRTATLESPERNLPTPKRLHLRPPNERDIQQIYAIAFHQHVLHLWAPGLPSMSEKRFAEMFWRRLEHRWAECVVFESADTNTILGFAYCYNINASSGTASLCLVFGPDFIKNSRCIEGAFHYLHQLFSRYDYLSCSGYRKLYAEVHAYNTNCVKVLKKSGFELEATLKKHQLWSGQFWDMHIFSLTSDSFRALTKQNAKLVEKLSCNTKKI